MNTKEVIDKIFKDPKTKYELTEFDIFGKSIDDIIEIYPKVIESGREAGKTKYFLKSFVPFASGKEEAQVFVENGKSCPEEIVRQLWVYNLIHTYGYKADEIELYPFDIRKFLVWEAPQSLQSEIRNLYDKALSLEKESKELLEKAKNQVEQLIEQAAGET